MRLTKLTALSFVLCLILAFTLGCAGTQKTAEPAKADWQFHNMTVNITTHNTLFKTPPKVHLELKS